MTVIRVMVIGIILAGVLAGIRALSKGGVPEGCTGSLITLFILIVGGLFIGSLFSGRPSSDDGMIVQEGPVGYHPPFKILEQGTDLRGRPYFIVQGDSHDASKITQGWTYPGNVSWVHDHIGYYKWKIHVKDWDITTTGR